MRKLPQHPDEHMALYEWCGAGTGGNGLVPPAETKRGHPWHASYGVLGLLTSLLILHGCDAREPVAKTSGKLERAGPQLKGTARSHRGDAASGAEAVADEPGPRPGEWDRRLRDDPPGDERVPALQRRSTRPPIVA
jgi:hypothetical protein